MPSQIGPIRSTSLFHLDIIPSTSIIVSYIFSVSYYTDPDIRISYGTSDSTVISSTETEAHNLNTTIASAAQRDGLPPENTHAHIPKNRQ